MIKSIIKIIVLLFLSSNALAAYKPLYLIVNASESIKVNSNASQEQVLAILNQIDTQSGLEKEGQQDLSYNSKLKSIKIIDAYEG